MSYSVAWKLLACRPEDTYRSFRNNRFLHYQ